MTKWYLIIFMLTYSSSGDFSSKIFRRIEHIKLTAMDVTGQIPGDYPKFDQKDHPRERMNFHE